ncbi:hypothetical protein [Aurantiacibacter luteus]|uniref:Uncharacterized protein n=1 Tax=Aurantiacibacter luteus TaxID=1581420 RepID=A0A0G9MNZ2_9SPHN|nr:hypothetical protein [Aurantiacibacter luteus]KLE32437.1 hypothetical protein AAW00_13460 [Aurantiacibacter luteus]
MLASPAPFPHAGSIAYRLHTAEPVRIQREHPDGTVLVERRRRLPGGATAPLPGASANLTMPRAELFETPDAAAHGGVGKARQSRRRRAAGGQG